ncbi:MAG: Veg family protein [Halanaerobiales bacterium]|nr:Veg family protein [Halanaerobiales bacterium]
MNKNTLSKIKREISNYLGKEVIIKADRGRRRSINKEGVLDKTYPSVFIVKIKDNGQDRILSFSYADLLTDTVKLKLKENRERIGVI